ncbi:MAG: aminotransferase [Planctomycetota bacterium]
METFERISAKMSKFRPSLTLALKRLAEERRRQKLPVYDFGLGETKGELDPSIRAAGERAFHEQHTMYSDPAGMPELRQAVLKWLGQENAYGIDNVIISSGAKQSLFNTFLAVCNPADCVLFDAAPWVSYQPLATAAYAFPVQVIPRERHEQDLKIVPEDLERNLRMRPHAKLFLLNNPVNPTAQLYDQHEVNALLDVCIKHRIYFVYDRLYWRLVFDGRKFPEPCIDDRTRPWLIQIDGMSKNFRRTGGLRIGWAIAPDDTAKAMVNLQSHYTSGPATPTQVAAITAISQPYDQGLHDELQALRDLIQKESEGMPHTRVWPTPATFYSFWDVRACLGKRTPDGKTISSSDDVSEYLCTSSGVITASGTGFMQDGYLRLSFATPREDIVQGMAAAKEALGKLR